MRGADLRGNLEERGQLTHSATIPGNGQMLVIETVGPPKQP